MSLSGYIHPHGEKILEDVYKILECSHRAQELQASLKEPSYKVTVITGPMSQAFVPDTQNIYLRVPRLYENAKEEQAIDLAGALAELAINRKNEPEKPELLENEDRLIQRHHKNLDMILEVFEVVREMENSGYRASKEIFRMGLRPLYKGWKKEMEYQKLGEIYWQIIEKRG